MAIFSRSLHAGADSQSQSRKAGQRPKEKRARQTNAKGAENFEDCRIAHPTLDTKHYQKKQQKNRQSNPYVLPRFLPTPAGSIAEFWKQRVRCQPKRRCRRQRQQQESQPPVPIF